MGHVTPQAGSARKALAPALPEEQLTCLLCPAEGPPEEAARAEGWPSVQEGKWV